MSSLIQSWYEPYNGFNFRYLFVTSVCLICLSHVVNLVYWIMRRSADPKVGGMSDRKKYKYSKGRGQKPQSRKLSVKEGGTPLSVNFFPLVFLEPTVR